MGSYSNFEVSGYLVGQTKNDFINVLMANFSIDNKHFYIDKDDYLNISYRAKTKEYAKILEINGFGLEQALKDFYSTLQNEILEGEYIDEDDIPIIKSITEEQLISSVRQIINNNLYDYTFCNAVLENMDVDEKIKRIISVLLTTATDTYEMKGLDGFFSDVRYLVQIICFCSNYSGEVVYDIAELVNGGWYSDNYDFINHALKALRQNNRTEKIIVLTEGKMDTFVLSESLKILYPYLVDCYSFLDFDEYNLAGGISDLAKMIKSFSAAGITNRIIAIFDNDTAAHDVIKSFRNSILPENIRIITYPELNHAKHYPTKGPTGVQFMDINGMACSIELYLGDSFIKENGEYIPIQWTGYIKSLGRYQGEILKKSEIYKNFEKLINTKQYLKEAHDWSGIELIFEHIFNVYKDY